MVNESFKGWLISLICAQIVGNVMLLVVEERVGLWHDQEQPPRDGRKWVFTITSLHDSRLSIEVNEVTTDVWLFVMCYRSYQA